MDSPSRGTIRPSPQNNDDQPMSSSQRLVPPSALGLDTARLAPGASSHLGYHGESSPQGTTTFAQAVGYYPSADRGSISPTNIAQRSPVSERAMRFPPIGEQGVYQESEDVRPRQQVSPFSSSDRLQILVSTLYIGLEPSLIRRNQSFVVSGTRTCRQRSRSIR